MAAIRFTRGEMPADCMTPWRAAGYGSLTLTRVHIMDARKRVVIIGANFGGLTTAMRLSDRYAVTVIDPSPYFEFLPNIHELVSGVKSAEQLRLSRRRLLRRAGHRFIQDAVTWLDPAAGCVATQSGEQLAFDACVVAVGGVNNTSGTPGADDFAMPFKSVRDCEAIGDRLQATIERQQRASVVIVGGGLEGVETLGEILRRYRDVSGLRVDLVDGSDRLLPSEPAGLGQRVQQLCQCYPVRLHLSARVSAVTPTSVELTSGVVLPADLTIWTGGAAAPPLLLESGLAERAGGWAPVRQTLQSQYVDRVFVVGDAAALPQPLSKQAYYAIDMGECAADNIDRLLRGASLRPFQPSFALSLISFGDLDAYLTLGGVTLASPALAPAKEFVYQFNMARYDPPCNVMSFFELQTRFWNGLVELALPTLWSPWSILRLSQFRLL